MKKLVVMYIMRREVYFVMQIVKRFEKFRDRNSVNKIIYGINIVVKNENSPQGVFINTEEVVDYDSVWIDINKLNNKKFLDEKGIEYILEDDDKNIIPVGLVDFTKPRKYYYTEINIWNNEGVELHKSNQIIKNIERAIQIKYEAVKFINRFDDFTKNKVEDTNLDLMV